MSRVAVVVPLRPGAYEAALRLVEAGPPIRLAESPLDGHCVFLTDREALFVFEGPEAERIVEQIAGEACVWQAATEWRELLDGNPRIAGSVFVWHRDD